MNGRIHSLESFGTVDGPGVRYVVFTQGCPMRCAYCHNPDTWEVNGGKETDPAYIIEQFNRNRGFYKGGGITVTGGEPLLQIDFLIDLFTQAKADDIHTCLDTSGIVYHTNDLEWLTKLDHLMTITDLVMLDIKHIDPIKHREITKQPNDKILEFAAYLNEKQVPMWIRHVVVPNLTDDEESLYRLGYEIGAFTNIKALDVLPYHDMGVVKYKNLGIPYPLEGTPAMDKTKALDKKQIVLDGIKKRRAEMQ